MPSENSQAFWILIMNAKRLIYLSLFLGTTCFNPSHAADPLDTVTDGNVHQLCERYHITEFKKTECLTSYQQLRQDQQLCEASELSKSQCLEKYQESLQRWKSSRKGKAIVISPAPRSSNSSNANRRDSSNANRRDWRDSSDSSNANQRDSSDLSNVNRQDSSFEQNYQQPSEPPVLNPNTTYEREYNRLPRPQAHGIREPQELRKPQGIREPQELRKPQELGQRQSIGGSSYELEYSKMQNSQ
jgi:hypothetical protein